MKTIYRTRMTLFDPIDVPAGEEIEIIMVDDDQPDFSLNLAPDDIDENFALMEKQITGTTSH